MDDDRSYSHRAKRQNTAEESSRKDRLIQIMIAITAVAALVVSAGGLVWSKESATAAKQSADAAARANQLAAQANKIAQAAAVNGEQSQEDAQANKVSYDVYWDTTNGGERLYFVRIRNLSAANIRDVFIIYGPTSIPRYYAYVNLVPSCSEWQAQENRKWWLQIYFEDAAGHYWEIDSQENLHRLTIQPNESGLTSYTSGWHAQEIPLSCAP